MNSLGLVEPCVIEAICATLQTNAIEEFNYKPFNYSERRMI